MSGLFFLFLVFMVIGLVIYLILRAAHEQQRMEQLRVVAGRMGFSFAAQAEAGLWGQVEGFYLFSRGRSRRIHNVMRRQIHDIDVTIFDYRYTTQNGKHSHTQCDAVPFHGCFFKSKSHSHCSCHAKGKEGRARNHAQSPYESNDKIEPQTALLFDRHKEQKENNGKESGQACSQKFCLEEEQRSIKRKYHPCYNTCLGIKNLTTQKPGKHADKRAYQYLYDLCRCNERTGYR